MDSWSLNHLFVGWGFNFNHIVSNTWQRTDKNSKHNHMLKIFSSPDLFLLSSHGCPFSRLGLIFSITPVVPKLGEEPDHVDAALGSVNSLV